MKFEMPKADRGRMEQLLEYLGDTSRYSEYYDGNRAEDLKKCFDIESEWCWKYADLVLRGLEHRELDYAEGHHVVPRSFYGVRNRNLKIDAGNWFVLSYPEHVWAHYCAANCSIGDMRGKMALAFLMMYQVTQLPSEKGVLDLIPDIELARIRAMGPRWSRVEAEGRTHTTEDLTQYCKDYYNSNKEKILCRVRGYYKDNHDDILKQKKTYRDENREKISERNKVFYDNNRERILEHRRDFYDNNRERILEQVKIYYEDNKDKISERMKKYSEENRDKISIYHKDYYRNNTEKFSDYRIEYYEANRDKILEQKKAYHEANRDRNIGKMKEYRDAKKAAGYRYRKDPVTGKRGWVFVGLPEQEAAA